MDMLLTIIGLGVKSGDISVNAYNSLKNTPLIISRTQNTLQSQILDEFKDKLISLDNVYLRSRNFDTLTKNIVKEVEKNLKTTDCCFVVSGSVTEDNSAKILLSKHKDAICYDGVSKSCDAITKCGIASCNYQSVSAYEFSDLQNVTYPLVIYDVDTVGLASEVKLKLADLVGDESRVYFCDNLGVKKQAVYEIDRGEKYGYSTVIVVPEYSLTQKCRFDFIDLYKIINRLRAKDGCPWDRVQTKESIRKNLIEECYELCDAIDKNDSDKICEEIGDVLLQAVFHTTFLEDSGEYTLSDVLSMICNKLIFRHSHVFGTDKAQNDATALDIWDKNKQVEKGFDHKEYVSDVPKCFPSLLRAQKTIKRIKKYSKNEIDAEKAQQILLKLISSGDYKNALLIICYILNIESLDGEEILYFAVDKILEKYLLADGDSFDIGNYFAEL